jgi:hypothetical protein
LAPSMNNAILFEENGIWVLASYKRYAGKARKLAMQKKSRSPGFQAMLDNQSPVENRVSQTNAGE